MVSDRESDAGGSIATDRASHFRQVISDETKKDKLVLQGGG